jgi:pimeloyl-ACP methyl ester carboxylesterase
MPTIDANGLTVAYETAGAGPPLILLHGATGSGRDVVRRTAGHLGDRFRVVAPDARGHAGTRWDVTAGLRTTDLVEDTIAVADRLGLGTFHVLGYSMGGMTALSLAARHGARLRSLVTISIATEREPRLSIGRALMDPDRIEREDPAWAADMVAAHDPNQGAGAWRHLLAAIVADIAEQPLLSPVELRGITAPTLVAAGDRDPFVPVDQAWRLSRQVRAGRLCVVPGAGHDLLGAGGAVLSAALASFYASIDLGPDQEDPP